MSTIRQVEELRILEIQTVNFESETQTDGSDEASGMSTYIVLVPICRKASPAVRKINDTFQSSTHNQSLMLSAGPSTPVLLRDRFRKFRNTFIAAPGVSQDPREKCPLEKGVLQDFSFRS